MANDFDAALITVQVGFDVGGTIYDTALTSSCIGVPKDTYDM